MAKNEDTPGKRSHEAIVLNLHQPGLLSALKCLPESIKGFEGKLDYDTALKINRK